MKSISIRLIAILSLFIITTTSCKKDSGAEENQMLRGTWTLSEIGSDANNNNQVDAGEVAPASSLNASGTITFNSDNTYTVNYNYFGMTDTETGTYSYSNNTITTVSGTETSQLFVNSLTNNKLIIKEANVSDSDWLVFTK